MWIPWDTPKSSIYMGFASINNPLNKEWPSSSTSHGHVTEETSGPRQTDDALVHGLGDGGVSRRAMELGMIQADPTHLFLDSAKLFQIDICII